MHVGGREADGPAALVARPDDALELVVVAQHVVGALDQAVGQGGADLGRGAGGTGDGDRVDRASPARARPRQLGQQVRVALPLVAEAEIAARA